MPADNSKLSANSGYTSFTISSILSRNDPKKDSITSSTNLPFIDANGGTVHDAAMLSRWVNYRIFGYLFENEIFKNGWKKVLISMKIESNDTIIWKIKAWKWMNLNVKRWLFVWV